MFELNNLSISDAIAYATLITTILVLLLGFYHAKTSKGRKIHDKLEMYNQIALNAVAEASKQSDLTGKEKKDWAINLAQNQLNSLGYKNASASVLASAVEQAYTKLFKLYDEAYNLSLSTNHDGSEKLADLNGNGVPDSQEVQPQENLSALPKEAPKDTVSNPKNIKNNYTVNVKAPTGATETNNVKVLDNLQAVK